MPIDDLGKITLVLSRLIEDRAPLFPTWQGDANISISPRPPDQSGGAPLTLFLYHLGRDASRENLETESAERSMPLILRYQLVAHGNSDDDNSYLDAQVALSCAMKALHNTPVLSKKTPVLAGDQPPNDTIFNKAGIKDCEDVFHVTLIPVSTSDAVSQWAPGDTPMRLSAYYEVAVEINSTYPMPSGIPVLSYGVQVFVQGQPYLFGSENDVNISPPDPYDPVVVTFSPAEVTFDETVSFPASNITGDEIDLLIQHKDWNDFAIADHFWNLGISSDCLTATVRNLSNGQAILPGLYAAKIRSTKIQSLPSGEQKRIERFSNQTPFIVTPTLESIVGPVGGLFTLKGGPFHNDEITTKDVAITVGGIPYAAKTDAGNPEAGQFKVTDGETIVFHLVADLESERTLPVRVSVNGADSTPNWVTAP